MSAADPNAPKVGDRFIRNDASWGLNDVREITAVGRSAALYVDSDGEEFRVSLAFIAEVWIAAPEPLVTESLTIANYGNGWWQSAGGFAGSRTLPIITILPDHTWREGP